MNEGDIISLILHNKIALFYNNFNESISFLQKNATSQISFSNELTIFPEGKYQLQLKQDKRLLFWIIDEPICKTNFIYMQTENQMNVNYHIPEFNEPICFISQSQFSKAYMSTSIVDDSNIKAEFRDSILIGRTAKRCPNTKQCSAMFNSPFFYRVIGGQNKILSIKLDVQYADPNISNCMIHSENALLNTAQMEVFCDTFSDDLKFYSNGFLLVVIVLVIFVISSRWLCPSACQSNEMNARFKNLKKDPFASPLEQPHGTADE